MGLGSFELRQVSLRVKKGEYLVLIGPTGTGKTVLLETIAGIHRPDRGKIFLKGQEVTNLPPEARNLGVVYQDYALFPHLSVSQNMAFGLRLRGEPGADVRKAVGEVSQFLEIGHLMDRRPGRLSGGERQRVALARALVLKPHMLLLDEPLSALDRSTRDRLRRELRRIHREIGVSVLHVTHDLNEAFFLADRLAVMEDGAILQQGSPQEVLNRPRKQFVAEILGIENIIPARLRDASHVFLEGLGPARLSVFPPGSFEEDQRIYVTIPGWTIDLFPEKAHDRYLYEGVMRVMALNYVNGYIEVELEHESGGYLRTSLSRREVASLPAPLELGKRVRTGLLREGISWIPVDEGGP